MQACIRVKTQKGLHRTLLHLFNQFSYKKNIGTYLYRAQKKLFRDMLYIILIVSCQRYSTLITFCLRLLELLESMGNTYRVFIP